MFLDVLKPIIFVRLTMLSFDLIEFITLHYTQNFSLIWRRIIRSISLIISLFLISYLLDFIIKKPTFLIRLLFIIIFLINRFFLSQKTVIYPSAFESVKNIISKNLENEFNSFIISFSFLIPACLFIGFFYLLTYLLKI